jgi:hypothetical protein
MRSIANILVGTLVLAAPLFVSLDASANSRVLEVEACGSLDLSAAVSCEVAGNLNTSVSCDPVNLSLEACAECALGCDANASIRCTAGCQLGCAVDCALNLNLDAALYCQAGCEADAQVVCAAKVAKGQCDSLVECEIAAYASCEAECSAAADLSVLATCGLKCGAACEAKCDAKANLNCQIDCQTNLYASLEAKCEADLDANAALFCDGSYVDVVDLNGCLNLLVSLGVDITSD